VLFAQMRMPYTEGLLKSIPKLEQPSQQPPPDHWRPAAGPRRPAAGMSVRAALRVRAREVSRRGTALRRSRDTRAYFKCWYPVGTPEGREALDRNLAAELPQAWPPWPVTRRRRESRGRVDGGYRYGALAVGGRRPAPVENLVVEFPVGRGRKSMRSRASASTSERAKPSASWASPLRQVDRPAGRSCSCRDRPRGALIFDGQDSQLSGEALRRIARSLQWIFQDPISSLIRAGESATSWREPLEVWGRGTDECA